VRNRGALILPLLSNSLERAMQVAEAMESRGYGISVRRTFYRDAPLLAEDVVALALQGVAAGLVVAMRFVGLAAYAYYPSLGALALSTGGWVALGILVLLLLSPILLAAWRRQRHD
jgi:energy-coupling factor transport system permease protein